MKYIKIKGTSLEVSNIVMGCMRLNSLDVREAQRHIETAIAAGINMFDHADIYGGGECEELFSKAIDMKSRIREKMIIQNIARSSKSGPCNVLSETDIMIFPGNIL